MSKYDPWRDHLTNQRADIVTMSFDELDELAHLPPSSRTYAEWWSNEDIRTTTHSQCKSWQAAGFKAEVDLIRETVTFRRGS